MNFLIRAVLMFALVVPVLATPSIDPLNNVTLPAGKSLIIPVTASSPNGRPLTFTATSSTNRIAVEIHTNNPFWKMSVAQVAPANAPGAFQTPFRGGSVTVTNIGDMTFMLFREIAPRTVDAIQGLTASGFYSSNTIFHRVVPGFVIQGGDPATNGMGGPVFRYDDEFNPNAIFSGNGQLALANSGKDTDGSQFFITAGPQRALDFGYTLFGQLLRGFNVVTNVINTPADTNSRPLTDVIITRASFVPDPFDTVLTLTGTNLAGVAGTLTVIADDGAGGRTTNSFTATTVTDSSGNNQPFFYPNTATNFVGPANNTLTNVLTATGLEGETLYWFLSFPAQVGLSGNFTNSVLTSSVGNITNVQGQLQLLVKPISNYVGSATVVVNVSSSSLWNYAPTLFPYDRQFYTFVFGDTPIVAQATNFTAFALTSFTNQPLATFTNGVPGSEATNFTALINWGDNSTNGGVILTNASGFKKVCGAHIYASAGDYPVYVTIQSYIGASATVVAMVHVPPTIDLARTETGNVLRWPAWATGYQLQSATNLAGADWLPVADFPVLNGYESVVTNQATDSIRYYRLME